MNVKMKYLDSSLSPKERTDDLLGRMTLEEKIHQLTTFVCSARKAYDFAEIAKKQIGNMGFLIDRDSPEDVADFVDGLQSAIIQESPWSIPAIMHMEALTGVQMAGATSFPTPIARASTWDPDIERAMAERIHDQMRSIGLRQALAPVFDVTRDPRWGRLSETYGEDETLNAAMATAYVQGLQGQDESDAVMATAKHFVGHGHSEGGLNCALNPLSERELREVHCKPFQAAITEGKLLGAMNSYCAVNREPVAASKHLLHDVLREEMKFDGLLVADYHAISRLIEPYRVAQDTVEAGIKTLASGIDVEYPGNDCYNAALLEAVADNRLDPQLIERAARRVLEMKFRIGLFESPKSDRTKMQQAFHAKENDEINKKMAAEAPVLLKNTNSTLPLNKTTTKRVAVVGPHADRLRSLFGHYTYAALVDMHYTAPDGQIPDRVYREKGLEPLGADDTRNVIGNYMRFPGDIRESGLRIDRRIERLYPETKTIYEAVADILPHAEVFTAQGIDYTGNNLSGYDEAIALASEADVIILTLGGQNGWGATNTNGEGIDNSNIDLPGRQEQFARAVGALGKKTVVVHIDSKPICNEYVLRRFDAVLEAWQLSTYAAETIVKILFGDINPSGKLPLTIAGGSDVLPLYHGAQRGSGYRSRLSESDPMANGYGYANKSLQPRYHFGFGLSYTQFAYTNLQMDDKTIPANGTLAFSVDVRNEGKIAGDEVVQVYVEDLYASTVRPYQQLVGFKRVSLAAGEKKTVRFLLQADQLAFLDPDMKWKVEGGEMGLKIGSSSEDVRLTASFQIDGDTYIDPAKRAFYARAKC